MKKFFSFMSVILLALSSQAQCDSTEHIMQGTLITNSVKSVKIKLDKNSEIPEIGQEGELNKYFENTLFGFKSTGWLTVAKIRVTSYTKSNNTLAIKVLEEQSEITVNGKKKNHFAKGNTVKFDWKSAPERKMYTKVEKGDTLIKGELFCGERNGIWEYYYPGGILQERDNYINGKADGNYSVFNTSGTLIEEGSYIMGKRDGALKTYFDDGTLKKNITYKDNVKNGDYWSYNEAGKPVYFVTYVNDAMTGPFKNFYKDGTLKEEGLMKEGKIQGELTGFYPSGAKFFQSGFEDDKKHGSFKKYHENGVVYQETTYQKGKINGPFQEYYESGQKAYSCNFKDDVMHGDYVVFYADGKKRMEGKYSNGIKIGFWSEFYEDDKPKSQGEYDEDGNRTGKWIDWNSNGKKKKTKY